MASTDIAADPGRAPTDTLLIDTDVHEYLNSKLDLYPYLSPYWRHYFDSYRFDKSPYAPSGLAYGTPSPFRDEWLLEDGRAGTSLEAMQSQLLEAENVSAAILCGFLHPSAMTGNFELARVLASAYNDWQTYEWLEKEPRLLGSVHVVADDPEEAAREIDRAAEHPRMVQVFLPTVNDRQYGDPRYRPIFEAAVRNDLAVAIHHGPHTTTPLGYPRHYFEWHMLAAPLTAIAQLTSILAGGVFDELPSLKLVLLETGVAWLPWFMWRADEQYKELRQVTPWMKRLPSEHVRDSVRIGTQPIADVSIRDFVRIVESVQADDVFLFSTDYPHYDADSAPHVLSAEMPTELRNKICYENALTTYPRLASLLR